MAEEIAIDATQAYEDLKHMVEVNPASTKLFCAVMCAAQQPIEHGQLVAQAREVRIPSTCTQTPANAINTLVRYGALAETIQVDGEPYAGTREQFRTDESITEDATVEYLVSLTDLGRALLADIMPQTRIAKLFSEKPDHVQAFTDVLAFCDTADGRTRDEIAAFLKEDDDVLRINPTTGFPTVYPAYFTGALEDAGALVWQGTWRLTAEGEQYLHEYL